MRIAALLVILVTGCASPRQPYPAPDRPIATLVANAVERRQEQAHRAVLESELRLWLSRANREWLR